MKDTVKILMIAAGVGFTLIAITWIGIIAMAISFVVKVFTHYLLPFVLIRSTNAKNAYNPIPISAITITDSILIYFSFILYTIISYFFLFIKR